MTSCDEGGGAKNRQNCVTSFMDGPNINSGIEAFIETLMGIMEEN